MLIFYKHFYKKKIKNSRFRRIYSSITFTHSNNTCIDDLNYLRFDNVKTYRVFPDPEPLAVRPPPSFSKTLRKSFSENLHILLIWPNPYLVPIRVSHHHIESLLSQSVPFHFFYYFTLCYF